MLRVIIVVGTKVDDANGTEEGDAKAEILVAAAAEVIAPEIFPGSVEIGPFNPISSSKTAGV